MTPLLSFTWDPIGAPEPTERKSGVSWFSAQSPIPATVSWSADPILIESWVPDGAKAVNAAVTYSAREGRWISDLEMAKRNRRRVGLDPSTFDQFFTATMEKYQGQLAKHFLAYSPATMLLLGSGK
jgi:hypothetical protein